MVSVLFYSEYAKRSVLQWIYGKRSVLQWIWQAFCFTVDMASVLFYSGYGKRCFTVDMVSVVQWIW